MATWCFALLGSLPSPPSIYVVSQYEGLILLLSFSPPACFGRAAMTTPGLFGSHNEIICPRMSIPYDTILVGASAKRSKQIRNRHCVAKTDSYPKHISTITHTHFGLERAIELFKLLVLIPVSSIWFRPAFPSRPPSTSNLPLSTKVRCLFSFGTLSNHQQRQKRILPGKHIVGLSCAIL